MNTQQLLQHCLLAASLVGATVCLAAVLAHHFRNQLRKLHERWLGLGPLGRVATLGLATVFVVYGSTKSPTNDPPDTTGGDAPTSPPPMMCSSLRPRLSAPPQQPTTDNQQLTTLPAWHRRGAYSDWQRIDFPSSFAFPLGTNLLTSTTLFAWGELRESLVGSSVCSFVGSIDASSTNQLTNQQTNQLSLSLSPGESSVTYGLTQSNSFLFSWQNVCVNRCATNRIDASIELFTSGAILITTQPTTQLTNQPTNKLTNYLPPTPPPGFIGQGQDTNWLAAAFSPTDFAVITNKGYARWLDEDYVGYNEENGHCRGTVTVHSMPPNGQPCYLVCGPHKVIVTEPGDYDFPVNVLTDYRIRTYPTDVPVTFSYDEGYHPDEDDYAPLLASPKRRLLGSSHPPTEIIARITPTLRLSPSHLSFSEMANRHIRIWCNMAQAAWEYVTLGPDEATLRFHNRHDAEVLDYRSTQLANILIYCRKHPEVCANLYLVPPYASGNPQGPSPSPTNAPPSETTP